MIRCFISLKYFDSQSDTTFPLFSCNGHGPTSAFVSYDILEDGGENITETGCYYELAFQNATETQSEKENMEKEIPSKNATKEILTNYSGGLGQQKLLIGKLTLNTTYKIWPYAKSRMGETIGDCITYTTTNDAIMLKEAGELQSLLSNNLYDYTSLTLAGPMNGDDLNCLRKMMGRNLDETNTPGKLASIDMTDVKIVAGGGPYGANRYVQDHVIGQGLFANCRLYSRWFVSRCSHGGRNHGVSSWQRKFRMMDRLGGVPQ
jgi:hypothetical protein